MTWVVADEAKHAINMSMDEIKAEKDIKRLEFVKLNATEEDYGCLSPESHYLFTQADAVWQKHRREEYAQLVDLLHIIKIDLKAAIGMPGVQVDIPDKYYPLLVKHLGRNEKCQNQKTIKLGRKIRSLKEILTKDTTSRVIPI